MVNHLGNSSHGDLKDTRACASGLLDVLPAEDTCAECVKDVCPSGHTVLEVFRPTSRVLGVCFSNVSGFAVSSGGQDVFLSSLLLSALLFLNYPSSSPPSLSNHSITLWPIFSSVSSSLLSSAHPPFFPLCPADAGSFLPSPLLFHAHSHPSLFSLLLI